MFFGGCPAREAPPPPLLLLLLVATTSPHDTDAEWRTETETERQTLETERQRNAGPARCGGHSTQQRTSSSVRQGICYGYATHAGSG
jgi:hypothetical protein